MGKAVGSSNGWHNKPRRLPPTGIPLKGTVDGIYRMIERGLEGWKNWSLIVIVKDSNVKDSNVKDFHTCFNWLV